MTEDRLPLAELLAKGGEADFLRGVAEAVLQLLMEADVEGLIGAGKHERSAERLNWRNGYRDRIAEGKARSALEFRRPTKALEDAIAGGGAGLRLLAVEGVTPLEGGVLIQSGGRIIGAIGVSGVLSSQDAQVARAGADAAAR